MAVGRHGRQVSGLIGGQRLQTAGVVEDAARGQPTVVDSRPQRADRLARGQQELRTPAFPGRWLAVSLKVMTGAHDDYRTHGRSAPAPHTAAVRSCPHCGEPVTLRYGGLVLACGVAARSLPGSPVHPERIHLLRTLDDAHGIDKAFGHARDRVTIVGGGFIGCELASTARARGLAATIIDVSATLLHRALGTTLGAIVANVHRTNGVRLHLGVGITRWEPHGAGVRLILEDGERIDSDTVVVGIGTTPNTSWLADSGLDITDGILAESTCHAVGAEDVVAAGDVARWPNLAFDTVPRRVEHWINAIETGQAAADALLAGRAAAQPFTPIPRFWSEQHGVKIQSVGMPDLGHELRIIEGTPDNGPFLAAFTQPPTAPGAIGHRLMGVVGIDSARRLLDYTPLIGRDVTIADTWQAQPV